MINIRKTEKGFTLIELMIVIAIIGILAAIAIPQFTTYRIKAFNAAAQSDVHTARLAEEALFADYQVYGSSALTGNAGSAVAVTGASASPVVATSTSGQEEALSISKNVTMFIETASSASVAGVAAQHLNGDRVFYAQTDISGLAFKSATAGTALAAKVTPTTDSSLPSGYTAL